jgi:hypothetical protein
MYVWYMVYLFTLCIKRRDVQAIEVGIIQTLSVNAHHRQVDGLSSINLVKSCLAKIM